VTDEDWSAIHSNLSKARKRWGVDARGLTREGAPSRTSAVFFTAIVQSTLPWGRGVGCDRPGLEGVGGAFIIGRRDGFRAACCSTSAGRVRELIARWKKIAAAGVATIESSVTTRQSPLVEICKRRRNIIRIDQAAGTYWWGW
jgi:hypothetical protein